MTFLTTPHPGLKRPYYLQIPELDRDIRGIVSQGKNNDIAIVIPLFSPDEGDFILQSQIVDTYCKRAVWLVYELFLATDIKETGVSVYIGVESEIAWILRYYMEKCNLPDDIVFCIDKDDFVFESNSRKIDMLCEASTRGFKKFISMDTHLAFLKDHTSGSKRIPLFETLDKVWKDEPFFLCRPWEKDYCYIFRDNMAVRQPKQYEDAILAYTGEPIDVWKDKDRLDLPSVRGGFFGVSEDVLRSDKAIADLKEINGFSHADETLLSLYIQRNSSTIATSHLMDHKIWQHPETLLSGLPKTYKLCHLQGLSPEAETGIVSYYESLLRQQTRQRGSELSLSRCDGSIGIRPSELDSLHCEEQRGLPVP